MGAATRNMLAKAALLLFAACAYAHDFKLCGTDNLGITAVDVAPDSPIPGQNLTVTFTAAPKQDIVSGDKLTITVKVFGVALGHVDFDSCSELGITCPVKAGTSSTLKATYLVPKAAPGGVPLTAEFTAKNAAGTQYSCVDVDVTMGKPPSTTPMRRAADAPRGDIPGEVRCLDPPAPSSRANRPCHLGRRDPQLPIRCHCAGDGRGCLGCPSSFIHQRHPDRRGSRHG